MITRIEKKVAEKLGLDDRIKVSANRDSFVTMKDHKPDFMNNPTCRLINPSKSEIGLISKQIADNINKKVIHATQVSQWKSASNVIQWFQAILGKTKHAFIILDVCNSVFYPSISEQRLMKAFDYASQFTTISQYHPREKVTPVPPEIAMGKKGHRQHVQRDYGFVRRRRDLRAHRNIYAIPNHRQLQRPRRT